MIETKQELENMIKQFDSIEHQVEDIKVCLYELEKMIATMRKNITITLHEHYGWNTIIKYNEAYILELMKDGQHAYPVINGEGIFYYVGRIGCDCELMNKLDREGLVVRFDNYSINGVQYNCYDITVKGKEKLRDYYEARN